MRYWVYCYRLLEVDVEGFEEGVLHGAARLLNDEKRPTNDFYRSASFRLEQCRHYL